MKVGHSSDPLFTMYANFAEEEDKKMTKRWTKDADGIIIFVRPLAEANLCTGGDLLYAKQTTLFSAVVAVLVAVSVQDLRPNPQDTSSFYLEKLYQLQADTNVPRPSTPSAMATPPAFSPPRYAVWVNSLWFLSLVISLSCAMLATLLQQWSRRYLTITQPARCEPHKRARARAFFAIGVDKFHVSWVVEALPALVHLSLFIFFAGLLIYLFNIHHTVFKVVVCWVALLTTVYGFITFMPIFWHDSPYYSPLSTTLWFLLGIIPYAVLKGLEIIARRYVSRFAYSIFLLRERFGQWISGGLEMAAEEARWKRQSEIDGHILGWTANALDEDDALERFIEMIPGFYKSDIVKDIPESVEWSIVGPLAEFMDRTLESNSVSGSDKTRRLALCFDVVNELRSDGLDYLFSCLVRVNWSGVESGEIGYFLRSLDKSSKGRSTPFIPGIIAQIVAHVREGDDLWTAHALDHLGVQEDVLRNYLTQGDSLSLANLIQFTRHADRSRSFAFFVVINLPEFDICNTLPELQHDFCAMWNQVVQEAQSGDANSRPVKILHVIRHYYIALHRGTGAAPTAFSEDTALSDNILYQPSSYPLCNLPSHRSNNVHDLPVAEATPPAATSSSSGIP